MRNKENSAAEIFLGAVPIGHWLKHWRVQRGYSQRELARISSVGRTTLHSLEKGLLRDLSLNALERLVRAMGLNLKDFFEWKDFIQNGKIEQGATEEVIYTLQYRTSGVEIGSFFPRSAPCFFGRMTLPPRGILSKEESPRSERMLYCVRSGGLLFEMQTRQVFVRKSQCIFFDGRGGYEIYNTDPCGAALTWLFSLPSFLRDSRGLNEKEHS